LMCAIGAEMTILSQDGERTVPAADFFLGVYLTAAGPGELLTRITIPAGKRDGFAAVTLGADGTCIANAAASITGSLRIALGCVDAVPIVVQPVSSDEGPVREAVRGAGLDPPADVHASSEYRGHLAEVLAVRAARQAVERS
jgi:aerobic carbon-monoxide dehydrogenase medium subunit